MKVVINCFECDRDFITTSYELSIFIDNDRPDMILCSSCKDELIGPIKEHDHKLDLIVGHLTMLELLSNNIDRKMLIDLGIEMCMFVKTKYPDPRARALHLALRLTFKEGERGLINKYLFTRQFFFSEV